MQRKLFTTRETANYLGLSEAALYQLVHRKKIPVVRFGRSLRFDIEALNRFIADNSVDPI